MYNHYREGSNGSDNAGKCGLALLAERSWERALTRSMELIFGIIKERACGNKSWRIDVQMIIEHGWRVLDRNGASVNS